MAASLTIVLLVCLFASVVTFERVLRPAIPLSGTLSLELVVTFGSLIYWFGVGELQARDLILLKVVAALILITTNRKHVSRRLSASAHLYRSKLLIFSASILFIIYFSMLATLSFLAGADANNIFVAMYVISSPVQGFIFTNLLDDFETEVSASWGHIAMLMLPSLLFIGFGSFFELERLILGSYAVGGLFAHFAVLCLMLAKRKALVAELFFIAAIMILCFEVYLGGSRRYMLPLLSLIFLWGLLQSRLSQVYLGHILILGFAIGLFWFFGDVNFFAKDSQGGVLERGLGYRDAEFSFYLGHLSWDRLITGIQFGFQELNVSHGSKGVTDVGPRLHNFYLTLLLNGGLILLTLFILLFGHRFFYILSQALTGRRQYDADVLLLMVFGLAWMVSAWFDLPPDGLWPLGLALFWLNMEGKSFSKKCLKRSVTDC